MLLLAVEPSLPLMAVVSLLSAAIASTATGTLAVVAFLRAQRENAASTKAVARLVTGDDSDSRLESHATQLQEIKKWQSHSERIFFALKKGLAEDHPAHRLWPDSR